MIEAVNGETRLCGLIGSPVAHTLSPVIHNGLAAVLGHNLVYVPFLVQKDLKSAVLGAFDLNILGVNVTVPYKKEVMAYLAGVDENAGRIGAVNTLVRTENGYKGYNTDYLGLKRAMESEGIFVKGRDVVVLGAGGAANAAVYMCAQSGAGRIYILNRTKKRAEELAGRVKEFFPDVELTALETGQYEKLPKESLIALQTTSVGLHPNADQAVITEEAFYKRIAQAMDIVYNPAHTRFMQLVEAQGGFACGGLKMLLYQAVTAYELWNKVSIDEAVCRQVSELLEKQL